MSNFKVTFSGGEAKMNSYRDYEQRNLDSFSRGGKRGGRGGRGGAPFKKGGNRRYKSGGGHYNQRGPNPRSRFEEDDVSMDDGATSTARDRYTPYGRQSKGGISKPGGRRGAAMDDKGRTSALRRLGLPVSGGRKYTPGRVPDSESNWWKVTIPFGAKASKDFVLKSITDMSTVPFVPIEYYTNENQAMFFVQDKSAAAAIASCSKRISMPTGHKMMILIRASRAPEISLTGEALDALKVTMSNRYDPPTKALNLSELARDAGLKQQNHFMPLNRSKVMASAVKIIKENIPEIESLDLSSNRLGFLGGLEELPQHTPNLTKLVLRDNQIRNLREMEKLKKFQLVELSLDGNPCCNSYQDETSYIAAVRQDRDNARLVAQGPGRHPVDISAVQKIFPKVVKLDGHDVPPSITFNLNENVTLPPTKGSFFQNEQTQKLVCLFLEQYLNIYDSGKRESLLDAYHDKAVFSLSMLYNPLLNKQTSLGEYLLESRNLLRNKDNYKRQKLIRSGKLNVLAFLSQLPSTQHDPSSMVVDVTIVTPVLMSFSVTGLFKETNAKGDNPPVRSFVRTFVTVPQGAGIVIINEQLTLTNATMNQQDMYLKQAAPTPSSSPVQDPQAGPSTSGMPDANIQLEMVRQFSQQSGMNADFSQKCLCQNNWDFDKAAVVFTELKTAGQIPPEAFIQ